MRPAVAPVAAFLATRLSQEIAPKLEGFSAGNAAMMGAMLQMMSEEWDRAASRLVEENAAVRVLLRRAANVLGDPSLADAAAGDDSDLRITEVLLATVLTSDKSRDIQFELYKYLFEAKVFPAKIEMRGDSVLETYEMLVPLLDELDIAHSEKSKLRKIEAFRKSLAEDIF